MDMDIGWWIKMFRLKDRPMAVQIWIILGIVLGLSFALNTLLFPVVLRYSFTNETYSRIEEAQEYILRYEDLEELSEELSDQKSVDHMFSPQKSNRPIHTVRHILLSEDGPLNSELPPEVLLQIIKEASKQQEEIKRYNRKIDKNEVFYVIRKVQIDGERVYLASYLWERYRNNLVKGTLRRLISLLIFILFISWIASIAITRYLTRPLVQLQSKVKDIALRKWESPVSLNRNDEIGKLGKSIDWMRLQLIEQDQKQQSFLQQVSHELKTPVMVIRSYVQSINDDIFPRGDMESSLNVIEEETKRLEERVHFLLNYTKYEYLSKHQLEREGFNMAEFISKTVNNFMWRNTDLNWELNFEPVKINGDREKLRISLENILDNQIRYASDTISIDLKNLSEESSEGFSSCIRIWNNGPAIEENILDKIFQKYKSGYQGKFGLGLAIAKLIVESHNGQIWVENENGGVAFYIKI